jgi:hypothetical protein
MMGILSTLDPESLMNILQSYQSERGPETSAQVIDHSQGLPAIAPPNMQSLQPPQSIMPPQVMQSPMVPQAGHKDFLKGLLSNFLFSLGQGLSASSQVPGPYQFGAAMGAAAQGPEILRQRHLQEAQQRQLIALELARQQQAEAQANKSNEMLDFQKANILSEIQNRRPPKGSVEERELEDFLAKNPGSGPMDFREFNLKKQHELANPHIPTFEESAYQEWKTDPKNKDGTRMGFLKEKANANLSDTERYIANFKKMHVGEGTDEELENKAMERLRTIGPVTSFNLQQGAGEVAPVSGASIQERFSNVPPQFRPMVQALIEYRRVPVGGFATKDPFWKKVLSYAYQVDPAYDEKEFPVRSKLYQSMTSGQDKKEIEAINTVLGHAGVLGEAVEALKNGNVTILNNIANRLNVAVGQSPVTTFQTIVNRVGPELTRAYVGTGGEQAEREVNKSDFDSSRSPDQLMDSISATIKLLHSKIRSKENNWLNTMKRDDFESRFISPEAKYVIGKWSPNKPGQPSPGMGVKIPTLDDFRKAPPDKPAIKRNGRIYAVINGIVKDVTP